MKNDDTGSQNNRHITAQEQKQTECGLEEREAKERLSSQREREKERDGGMERKVTQRSWQGQVHKEEEKQ